MYCPACDKEFSPVHSRCPECKGWLRVSGPTVGSAKPAINPIRPQSSCSVESATTQKVKPIIRSNDFQLPARPKSAPEAEPAARKIDHLPGPGLQTATEPVESLGRGALGTGWESSNSFAAPSASSPPPTSPSSWGAPAPSSSGPAATTGWGTPATGGWGSSAPTPPEPLKATGWGSSAPSFAPTPPDGGGLAGGNGGFAPASSGPGFAGGLGSGPASGQLGGPAGPPGGGGWLGDGGGGSNANAYAPPARGGGWLGDSGAGPSSAPPPLSMPPLAPPELSTSSADALALPDHTVAVDLGTPWEDEVPAGGASNQMIYIVLGCLILSLTAFSGYIFWQQRRLKEPVKPAEIDTKGSALELGKNNLRQAQTAFKARRYREAQEYAQSALVLVDKLPVASDEDRKAVRGFYRQATTRYAASLCEEAQRAAKNGEITQAGGMAEQAANMYANLPDSQKEQSQALALEGRIYLNSGDAAAAMSAFSKANALRPGAYAAEMRQARAMGAPPPDIVAPPPVQPLAPEDQPKIDTPGYPSRPGGAYHSGHRTDPVPVAPAVGPAPKPRPVNTYVPPKKDDRPSWRKKPSDRYPGS